MSNLSRPLLRWGQSHEVSDVTLPKCQLPSHVQLFVTPWMVACQAPLSQEPHKASGLCLQSSFPFSLKTQPGFTSTETDFPPPSVYSRSRLGMHEGYDPPPPTHTQMSASDHTPSWMMKTAVQDTGGMVCSSLHILGSHLENLFVHSQEGARKSRCKTAPSSAYWLSAEETR